jgi:NADH-quinone oxidoreductase subunit L
MIGTLQSAMAIALGAPGALLLVLASLAWFGARPSERFVKTATGVTFLLSMVSCLGAGALMAAQGIDEVRLGFGTWATVGHLHLDVDLTLDRLSVPFAAFGACLVGLVGAFSSRYLHKEPGFGRFYVLLALLGTGFQMVVLAGRMEIVLFGWELVGMTSALLIAFFHDRPAPVRHGLRAFITYRACDFALLLSIVWVHHLGLETGFTDHGAAWASPEIPPSAGAATAIGLLLLIASMGKSALFPLTEWLPRAMEGPTPSSAIFYGALSIHLGPYLLLRNAPYLEAAPAVRIAVGVLGLLTVLHASLVGRVQSDIKSALAYASAAQVGLIMVEIALGFYFLAIAHVVGHAALRTLQILRSPSVLADFQRSGGLQRPGPGPLIRWLPVSLRLWLYRYGLERGYADAAGRALWRGLVGVLSRIDLPPSRTDETPTAGGVSECMVAVAAQEGA